MSTQPDMPHTLDPFGTLRAMRDANLETWSKLMIDLVNSEAYSLATSQWLDTCVTMSQPFQRVIETTMTQVLTGLNAHACGCDAPGGAHDQRGDAPGRPGCQAR
jgi:hypothetical protein